MGHETVGVIGVIILLLLMFLRMPVGFAMTLVGFGGTAIIAGMGGGIGVLKTVPYSSIASYGFAVIPLFMVLGEFAFQGGMTDKLYSSAYKMVGHFKGGLATATLLACGVFAAISGSSVATAGAMGKVAIPDMKKYNYDPAFSAATVVAGGSLGILIPPSVIAVIYAILTEQSVGKVLLALVIPGLILLAMYIICAYIIVTIRPEVAPRGEHHSGKEQIRAFLDVLPILAIFVLIIGGIYKGVFTASEAAGVGAFIVLLYGIINRKMTPKDAFMALEVFGFIVLIIVLLIDILVLINRIVHKQWEAEKPKDDVRIDSSSLAGGFNRGMKILWKENILTYVNRSKLEM